MTFDSIKNFFVVLLALCGAISVVGGAINLILNWKKENQISQNIRNSHNKFDGYHSPSIINHQPSIYK